MLENTTWHRERGETLSGDYTRWSLRGDSGNAYITLLLSGSEQEACYEMGVFNKGLLERAGLEGDVGSDGRLSAYTVDTHGRYLDADETGDLLTRLGLGRKRPHFRAEQKYLFPGRETSS